MVGALGRAGGGTFFEALVADTLDIGRSARQGAGVAGRAVKRPMGRGRPGAAGAPTSEARIGVVGE
ncbi:hypothetical protein ACBJ59_26795 [Nonomuraea sp. MTCD27]|uniref:hypothetical protein n=1 Tax=Nonomuraea sp. MTCD27 TaxID=1676747 RepID=UPI0035BF5C4B